jgi:hypothetical protein
MRIPALRTLWLYRNRTCYIEEKKVDPAGEGWAKLTSVPPHTVAYWVPFYALFDIGIPLRDERGIQRQYNEKETR